MTDETYDSKNIADVLAAGKTDTVRGVKAGEAIAPGDPIRVASGIAYATKISDAKVTGFVASLPGHDNDADFDIGDIIEYYPVGQKTTIYAKLCPAGVLSGYQECGLTGKTGSTATGLSTTTQYYFKITIDGGTVVEYDITTASDVTYDAVIALMNAEVTDAEFSLEGGDLRCTTISTGNGSAILLAAGTTGTNLFATLTNFTDFEAAVAGLFITIEEGEVASLSATDDQIKKFAYTDTAVATDTLLLKVGRFAKADDGHAVDVHIIKIDLAG